MQPQPELLKKAVRRVSGDWLEIYAKRDDAEFLIKSLLLGVEHNIRWRIGQMSGDNYRKWPQGVDHKAFAVGLECADQIPESILRRACKF